MKLYTHTTIIQPLTSIRVARTLPQNGEITVRPGQEVNPMQVVARTPLSTDFMILPFSEPLGISDEEKLLEALLINPGEPVSMGELLAEKKGRFRSKQITSPVDGALISLWNGNLILAHTSEWLQTRAMVQGRVVNTNERGVELEVIGAHIQGSWATNEDTIGTLRMASTNPGQTITAENIAAAATDIIFVGGRLDDVSLLQTLANSDIRGIILGSMPAELCQAAESLELSILLTDGIGAQPMAAPIFELLQQLEETSATLFTHQHPTQFKRPEIVAPKEGVPSSVEAPLFYKSLAVGQTVRILKAPYQSQIGTVTYLHDRRHETPDGISSLGASVRLATGKIVFVPVANLDALI